MRAAVAGEKKFDMQYRLVMKRSFVHEKTCQYSMISGS